MLFLLLACKEPGLLSSVTIKLSEGTLEEALPAMGLGLGAAAVVAEICPLEGVNGYTFTGLGAESLGITDFMGESSETSARITFPHAGIANHPGGLVISTDADRINWTFTWLRPAGSLSYEAFADEVVRLLENGLMGVRT